MATVSLHSIKRENTLAILKSIAGKKHTTKLELSEETGLSLMTVGKIISVLGENGIITHGKNVSQKAGRRAEVFSIRHDWLIPIFEISSRVFKFYITDLKGCVIDKTIRRVSCEPQYVANEFVSFMQQTLSLLQSSYKKQKALGIGVSVAGVYDEENDCIRSSMLPELSSIKLMNNINKLFKNKNVIIENANRLCAAGIIESQSDYREKTISCLTVGDAIECTTCDKGTYISGNKNLAGRLGDIPYSVGSTYANFIRNAVDASFIEDPVIDLVKIISAAYSPDIIYLCSDKFSFIPTAVKRIESSLHSGMLWPSTRPQIRFVHSTELESIGAVISRVIELWLDEILIKHT